MSLASAPGCTGDCVGASCSDLYPRLDLGFFGVDTLRSDGLDARSPDTTLSLTADDGLDASFATTDRLYVGVPAVGEVRMWSGAEVLAGSDATVLSARVSGDRFGASVAARGDRVLVGAPDHARSATVAAAGAVYVFDSATPTALGQASHVVTGSEADGRLGSRVWACGDLDGDGADDWAAQAPWAGDELQGALLLGLSATLPADVNLDSADLPALGGTGADAAFGTAAACSEPLAGAPNATLVVGAPFAAADGHDAAGTVSIWSSVADTSAGPALVLTGDEAGAYFGTSVATGDLDADGFPELVVGAPGQDAPGVDGGVGGAVYVYAGTDLQEALGTGVAPQQVRTMRGEFSRGRFGNAIVVADLDADGTDDLFVGAPGTNRTGEVATTHAGEACGWWGPYTDWPEAAFSTDASVLLAADRQYLEVGEALATLDLDGDGALELAVRLRQPTRNKR